MYFYLHLIILVAFSIVMEFQTNRNFAKIVYFLVTILYQVAIFYSITDYALLFKKDLPLDEGHGGLPIRNLTPFHMKNIIQFWIISEITIYVASIVCIVIVLGMSSCCKLKRMKPITALTDD